VSDIAKVQAEDPRALRGPALLLLAAASLVASVVFPAGIAFALAIAILSMVQLSRASASRRYYWGAFALSALGVTLSLMAGLATSSVGS